MALEDHLPKDFVMPPETSDKASFWAHFWRQGVTPWDLGCPHPELENRLPALGQPGRAFVPGCGRGHDALLLAVSGWEVTALDFCAEAAHGLNAALATFDGCFMAADALKFDAEEGFDLWWDHTFLCALPPERRSDWGRRAATLIRPGGLLAALIFPRGKDLSEGGPPFGLEPTDLSQALASNFECLVDENVRAPGRDQGESFALFRRC